MEPPMKVEFSNSTGAWIDCTADGYPPPRISWVNVDYHPIANMPHLRRVLNNGTLVFQAFSATDYRQNVHNTIYRCSASNSVGTIVSRDVVVRGVVNQYYTIEGQVINAYRGCTAILQCTIPTYVKDYVKVVAWIQEPSFHIYPSIQGDGKYHALPTGELLIYDMDYRVHYQSYRCRTLNRLTKQEVLSDSMVVRLLDSRGNIGPSIVSYTSTVEVPRDEGAVLACVAQGCPQPDYRWYQIHHGTEAVFVLPGPRTRMFGPLLAIEASSLDDGGVYRCVASNNAGEANVEIQLVVTWPLIVEVTPAVQKANLGDEAIFRCEIQYPDQGIFPSIHWFKNGRKFYGEWDKGAQFVINEVSQSNIGMYQCLVKKKEGETAQAAGELRLGDSAPVLVNTFIEQTMQPGPPVSLKCVATGNPLPYIYWTLDGFPLPESERFISKMEWNHGSDTVGYINITHVTTEDGGEYTCTAKNRVGKISHSARLNIYGLPYIRPIPKTTAIAGEMLQINCPVSGYPIEHISWEKDRKELPTDLRQKITNGVLIIDPVQKGIDSGTYTCTARNKQGQSARRSGEIYVIVPPKLSSIAPYRTLNVGERASLTCSVVKGDLPLTIAWSKNKRPLSKAKDQMSITQVDQYNSLLVIDGVAPHHSGNYSCLARNPVAEEIISQHLTVNVPPSIEPFYFPTDGLLENTRTRVICGVNKGDPPLEIGWLKDGAVIPPKLGVNVSTIDQYSSLLSISNLTSAHSGEYTCVAKNPADRVRYSSKLQVKVPPKWIVEPTDVNVERGKHAVIECRAEGVPQPTQLWKKAIGEKSGDYDEIRDSSRIKLLGNGSLLLQNTDDNMEGFYLCQASNGIGNAIGKVIELKVQSPPYFSSPSKTITVRKGEIAKMQCNVSGDKPITIKWIRNGRIELSSTTNYRVIVRQDSNAEGGVLGEMQITSVDGGDAGTYFCQASNSYGKEQQMLNLHVLEPPDSPKDLRVVMVNRRTINIQWQSDPNTEAEVSKYIVQYKFKNRDWMHTVVNGQMKGALLENLRPATRYIIRVLAESPAGQSKPSADITVTTNPDSPEGSPTNIKIETVSATELALSWSPPDEDFRNGEIQSYIILVHSDRDASVNALQVLSTGEETQEVLVKNLMKHTLYKFSMKAHNEIGVGPLSLQIVGKTLEDVPDKPPNNIMCTALGSRSLQISWQPPTEIHTNGVIKGYRIQYDAVTDHIDDFGIHETSSLTVVFNKLYRYTNYSVEVLAYTRLGVGVYSEPIYCATEEDAPGPPESIKVLVSSPKSYLVSWLPPSEPNGIILKYYLYTRVTDNHGVVSENDKISLPAHITLFEMKDVKPRLTYQFWVTAVTKVGEGQSTSVVNHILSEKASIQLSISSFGVQFRKPWHTSVALHCNAVGIPPIRWQWIRGEHQVTQRNIRQNNNSELILNYLQKSDSSNYTCIVQNSMDTDKVTYELIVQVPPGPPLLYLTSSTSNSVLLHWKVPDDGGAPIQGYIVNYKMENEDENQIRLTKRITVYELKDLTCGHSYQINLIARNKLGTSKPSQTLAVRTQGQKPGVPQRSEFITPNISSVLLNLQTWPDNGCPIEYYVVKYRKQSNGEWIVASGRLYPQRKALIVNLQPSTEYHLQVEGHSVAGSSVGDFYFSTLTADGAIPPPPESVKKGELSRPFYMNTGVIVSAVSVTAFLVLIVTVTVICRKKQKSKEKRKPSLDEQNLNTQRERFYATLQKSVQEDTDKIPETASDISPYATFHVGESNDTLLHSIMLQEIPTSENLATPQTTICKTRKVRRRSNRRPEIMPTEDSDSDGNHILSSRTESSNQLDLSLKAKREYIYHGGQSSTSSDISPRSDHKNHQQRGQRPRLPIPNKSIRVPLIPESAFRTEKESPIDVERNIDSMKKIKLGVRSSLWTRPLAGSNNNQHHTDYSIAV